MLGAGGRRRETGTHDPHGSRVLLGGQEGQDHWHRLRAGGQCGYLRTGKLRVFPFSPSGGTWTLQIDTRRRYAKRPGGPVARISVQIHKA